MLPLKLALYFPLALLLLFVPMHIHIGIFAHMHRRTYSMHAQRDGEGKRNCVQNSKFLSVCEAAAVEVM